MRAVIEEIGMEDVDEEVEHEAVILEGGEVEEQDEEEWVKEVSEEVGRKEVGLDVCKGREVLDFDGAWTKKKNLKKRVEERQYKKRGQESLVMPEDEKVGEERRESAWIKLAKADSRAEIRELSEERVREDALMQWGQTKGKVGATCLDTPTHLQWLQQLQDSHSIMLPESRLEPQTHLTISTAGGPGLDSTSPQRRRRRRK